MSTEAIVPAWKKKLNLAQIKETNSNNGANETNESLKVVKHLSSDSILSKRDKKSIINQQNKVSKKKQEKIRNKSKIVDKVKKHDLLNATFLRDQFKYLIEYYIYKYSVGELPEIIKNQENVKANMELEETAIKSWKFNKNKQIWLLKNVFANEDKIKETLMIPSIYDTVLVEYFINLPSESAIKKDLIEKSWNILKSWNEGVVKQREHMLKMLNEEDEEKEEKEETKNEEDNTKKEEVVLPNKEIVARAHNIVLNLDKINTASFELEKI
ncbi:hypothetical protein QEN19_003397 [Hanseniaspora menglaensis]